MDKTSYRVFAKEGKRNAAVFLYLGFPYLPGIMVLMYFSCVIPVSFLIVASQSAKDSHFRISSIIMPVWVTQNRRDLDGERWREIGLLINRSRYLVQKTVVAALPIFNIIT